MTDFITDEIALREGRIGTADEHDSDQEVLELLNEIYRRSMTPTKTDRPPFPVDKFTDGECPECGYEGSVQACDNPVRYWDSAEVIDGVLGFDGHFETTDDGTDERISCWNCGTEWEMPEDVEYR